MSNVREEIMVGLEALGLGTTSYDEVVTAFKTSDMLSKYLTESDDIDEVIVSHLQDYDHFIKLGDYHQASTADEETDPTAVFAPQEVDPTETSAGGTASTGKKKKKDKVESVPAVDVDAVTSALICDMLEASAKERRQQTEQACVTAVLTDKPYPGEWMKGIGKLSPRKDAKTLLDEINKRIKPSDQEIERLLASSEGGVLIPTSAQLADLAARWEKSHRDANDPNKHTYSSDPSWYKFNNDEAINNIKQVLSSESATFDVYIPPLTDTTVDGEKLKGWRWPTKGFEIECVDTSKVGSLEKKTMNISKQNTLAWLAMNTEGMVEPKPNFPLGIVLSSIEKEETDVREPSMKKKKRYPRVRVIGNSPKCNPVVKQICVQSERKADVIVRSEMFYYEVRFKGSTDSTSANKSESFTVRKVRIPLVWKDAPVWVVKTEYTDAFATDADGRLASTRVSNSSKTAQQMLAETLALSTKKDYATEYGLVLVHEAVEEARNKSAAEQDAHAARDLSDDML